MQIIVNASEYVIVYVSYCTIYCDKTIEVQVRWMRNRFSNSKTILSRN